MKEIFIDLSYEHGLKSMKIWRDQDMMRKDDTKLEIGQRETERAQESGNLCYIKGE